MRRLALAATLALLLPFPLGAAEAPPLRSADAVLADYAAALGGEKAWRRHRTLRLKREVEVRGMNIKGTEERWLTATGKLLTVTTLPGIGTIRQGSNGKVAWAEDPINGLRLLEGAEAEAARIESTWGADLQLKKLYRSITAVAPPSPAPADRRLECLELVPRIGKPAVTCFDAQTHLRVLQKGVHATPQGEVPYTATFDDWREVGGVRLPFREEMTAGPMSLEARVVEVKFGEKMDAKRFEVPKAGK